MTTELTPKTLRAEAQSQFSRGLLSMWEVRRIDAHADAWAADRAALAEAVLACAHAVDHHRPYEDESGVVSISLHSYGLIRQVQLQHQPLIERLRQAALAAAGEEGVA